MPQTNTKKPNTKNKTSVNSLQKAKPFRFSAAALAISVVSAAGIAFVAFSHASSGVTAPAQTIMNVKYANVSSAQKLDLILPKRTGTPIPVVVNIHGGGWYEGDKSEETYNVDKLVAAGYGVASINYRLSGEAKFPAGAQDVKAAIRWLRANASTYGFDTGKFAAWGSSAGAYMAIMAGVTGDQATTFDNDSLGNAGVSSEVGAVVDVYGPVNLGTMQAGQDRVCPGGYDHNSSSSSESKWLGSPLKTSPLTPASNLTSYIPGAKKLPKFIAFHGKKDCIVPYTQTTELVDALAAVGNTASATYMDGLGHSDSRIDNASVTPGIAFLNQTLGWNGAATATSVPSPSISVKPSASPSPTAVPSLSPTPTPWRTPVPSPSTTPAAPGPGAYDDKVFVYTGGWSVLASGGKFNGSDRISGNTNATYSFQFAGNKALVYATNGKGYGKAAISIDGGAETIADFYASSDSGQRLVYTSPALGGGVHTIKVRVTGTKNPSSRAVTISADKIVVQ